MIEVVKETARMRELVRNVQKEGRAVGLVPTMGFFHEGHLELMRRSSADNDVTVVTLFVNPTQFGPGEDFEDYPRDFDLDCRLASCAGADCIFAPEVAMMYPEGFETSVAVEKLSALMCGVRRPGHFRGVATVVAKLFNIVPADSAYFGQKDAQQLAVIKRMARDLDFPVRIVAVPTVREADGLAMSSRNTYLSEEDRSRATALYRSLEAARARVESGSRSAAVIRAAMEEVLGGESGVDVEYIAICDNIYLEPLEQLSGEVLVALSARVGRARLIDNMVFEI